MSTSSTSGGADDRVEAIVRPEESRPLAMMPGVELRPMADATRGARGLFAGLLTLGPGASIPYYARVTSEAMVVLEGAAAVAELALRATSQDLYDARLGTRDLCGGYARFEPGARLPCHRHPGDEAITIIQGTATCIVEGRRLINLTLEPMAMVWACAGGLPDMAVGGEHPRHPATARGTR